MVFRSSVNPFSLCLHQVYTGSWLGAQQASISKEELAVKELCADFVRIFFFCCCPSLSTFPSSMRWFQETSSLWIHHNMWPLLSWEVKNTDFYIRGGKEWDIPQGLNLINTSEISPSQLYQYWEMQRNLKKQQNVRLCTSKFSCSKNKIVFLCQNYLVHLFNSKEA